MPQTFARCAPDLSSEVAQVVAMAPKKLPEARYQTGRQLAAALRQAAAGSGAAQKEMPTSEAVVYDAHRDASGHEMVDFQETVMEPRREVRQPRRFQAPNDARRNIHDLRIFRADRQGARAHEQRRCGWVTIDADAQVAILADGMGGYNAGEVASGMATTFIRTEMARWLEKCF